MLAFAAMGIRAVVSGFLTLSLVSAAASTLGRGGIRAHRQLPGFNLSGMATAADGSVVIGGSATAAGLPVTDNAIMKTFAGATCVAGGSPYPYYTCNEGYIGRFAPDGTLLYGTYLWDGGDVTVAAVAVAADGTIYAAVDARGGFYGIPNPPNNDGAARAFVIAIDPARATFGRAFMVAEAPQIAVAKIALDRAGTVYLAGSCAIGTLAATAGAYLPQASGPGEAACALAYPSGSSTASYATYLGDSQSTVTGLAVDDSGTAYFAGATRSAPVAGPANSQSYVLALDPAGASVLWSAIFGGPDAGGAVDLLRNARGEIVAIGIAELFPQFTVNADLTPVRPIQVVKFSANLQQPVYSVLAAEGADPSTVAAMLAEDGTLLLTGMTFTRFPGGMDNPQLATTADALERCVSGAKTRFFERLAPTDGHVEYASYFGADQQSLRSGISAGPNDSAYTMAVGQTAPAGSTLFVLTPESAPQTSRLCAVNAANLRPDALAPGALVTLFGSALGPADAVVATPDTQGNYPTELAGTSVLLNGSPIPLVAASANQIHAILPPSLPSTGRIEVRSAASTQTLDAQFQTAAPALFGRLGLVAAVAYNEDGTPNGPGNPALRGSTVRVFGTGFGQPAQILPAFIANQPVAVASAREGPAGILALGLTVPTYLPPAYLQVAPISFEQSSGFVETGVFLWVR